MRNECNPTDAMKPKNTFNLNRHKYATRIEKGKSELNYV